MTAWFRPRLVIPALLALAVASLLAAAAQAAPPAPKSLKATAGDRYITLNWKDPKDSSITRYEYRRKVGSARRWEDWTAIAGSTAATTSHKFSNLVNLTEYHFQIRAVNGADEGKNTKTFTVRPIGPPEIVITSSPADGNSYTYTSDTARECVVASVTFGYVVVATVSLIRLHIDLDEEHSSRRLNSVNSALRNESTNWTFKWCLQGRFVSQDRDYDGISIPRNPFDISLGGRNARLYDKNNAKITIDLSHPGLPAQSGHKINMQHAAPRIRATARSSCAPTRWWPATRTPTG